MAPQNPNNVGALAAVYEHCAADIRQFDLVTYQIPSIAAALFYAFSWAADTMHDWRGTMVWFVGFFMIGSLTLAFHKHRAFQESRVNDLRKVIEELSKLAPTFSVAITTKEVIERYPEIEKGMITDIRAHTWLQASMVLLTFISLVLFLHALASALAK